MIDFRISPELEEIRLRMRTFVDGHLIPLESDPATYDDHENIRLDLLEEMRALARGQGLWAPQMPKARGGMALSVVERAVLYEEANRSLFGPVCINGAAPDDGNMSVLEKVGTDAQKEKWLQPIVDGEVFSAFTMTEPHPGGGSDPTMIRTRAAKDGGDWVINGAKWFATGAGVASHFILVAKTSDDPRRGLTAFLFHKDTPGFTIKRRIPIMGPEEHGGHCELEFKDMRIPDEDRLMEEGDGLKLTQIRLGPARLTHCMRWLGLAKRCMAITGEYIEDREGFGVRLKDRESVQLKMGEVAHNIEVGRLLTMSAAWKLDQGDYARKEISMAKIHVANTLHHAADTAIQLNGARGYSKDSILEWVYRYARAARLVDGADEIHKMVLAKFYGREGDDFWSWDVQ